MVAAHNFAYGTNLLSSPMVLSCRSLFYFLPFLFLKRFHYGKALFASKVTTILLKKDRDKEKNNQTNLLAYKVSALLESESGFSNPSL